MPYDALIGGGIAAAVGIGIALFTNCLSTRKDRGLAKRRQELEDRRAKERQELEDDRARKRLSRVRFVLSEELKANHDFIESNPLPKTGMNQITEGCRAIASSVSSAAYRTLLAEAVALPDDEVETLAQAYRACEYLKTQAEKQYAIVLDNQNACNTACDRLSPLLVKAGEAIKEALETIGQDSLQSKV